MPIITLRFANADDAGLLLQLIRELAAYERAPDAVVATEEDLRRHGFGPEPRFEALIAGVDGKAAGFALFFPDFSTWHGRPGIYLEDLYVRDWARGLGVGRRLIARLAAIAIERDSPALRLAVLNWNRRATSITGSASRRGPNGCPTARRATRSAGSRRRMCATTVASPQHWDAIVEKSCRPLSCDIPRRPPEPS